jgi:Terminase large subunit, T4likevirus-type, N-terminal
VKLSDHGVRLIAELARREPAVMVEGSEENAASLKLRAECAADLRAWFHPKQRAFFTSKAERRATSKTRRAGITSGGCRELLARCIETNDYRAMYAATTMDEARDRAWLNDTKTGLIDCLRAKGERIYHKTLQAYRLGGVDIIVHDGDSYLEFSNGSEIELFGAEHEKAQRKKRGVAKHVIWVDEAQDFPALENFLDAAIGAAMSDFSGEIWITGTPGRDCLGRFYDITKDVDEGRLPNWEVHVMNVTDNPKFGRVVEEQCDDGTIWWVEDNLLARTGPFQSLEEAEAEAIKVRWDRTAGKEILEKNLKGDEPDFVREWLGRWVKEDARFVYPIHSVPKHKLLFAPQRLVDNPFRHSDPDGRFDKHPDWYDHEAAVRDLPRPTTGRREYQWLHAIAADFGYSPDPFALVVWAFCHELPDVYEMFSWKCTKVHTDDQGLYIKTLWSAVPNIVSFVGDPAGKQDDFEVWRTRMNLPIEEANKRGKNTLEEFLADDIRRARVHLRDGSPLHLEMKHLAYLPGKPGKPREVAKHRKVNGVVHGDHCCDAARYGYADLHHFLAKERVPPPPAGSPAAFLAEAKHHEKRIDDAMKRATEYGDELANRSGGYEW